MRVIEYLEFLKRILAYFTQCITFKVINKISFITTFLFYKNIEVEKYEQIMNKLTLTEAAL